MPTNIFARASLDQAAVTALRVQAGQGAQEMARATNSQADLLYRNLRPTDVLGGTVSGRLNNPVALTAQTYAADVFPLFTTKQNQAFAIYGFVNMIATPQIDELTIYVASQPVAVLPMDEVYAQGGAQAKVGYIFDPIWVPPGLVHCRIDMLSFAGQTINTEQFALLGFVAETAGLTVNTQTNGPNASARTVSG